MIIIILALCVVAGWVISRPIVNAFGVQAMTTKLMVRVTGTRDWQCKSFMFDNIFDFEDHCIQVDPTKEKQIKDYIDIKDLCSTMSDCFVVYSYEWYKTN